MSRVKPATLVVVIAMVGTLGTGGAVYDFFHLTDRISSQQVEIRAQQYELQKLDKRLVATVSASAATRVTTVTQRCNLTYLDAQSEIANANIIGEFAPKLISPFDALKVEYLKSYQGCLKQLEQVKRIAKAAP